MFSRLKSIASEQAAAFAAEYEATAAAAATSADDDDQRDTPPATASSEPVSMPAGMAGADSTVDDATNSADGKLSSIGAAKAAGSGWMGRINVSGGWMNSSLSKVKTFIPDSVESFRTEHEVTAAQAATADTGSVRPPWEALTDAELPFAMEIKTACAELATSSLKDRERRQQIFMTAPPVAANFDFSLSTMMPTALACLAADSNLEQLRFGLVPRKVKEEVRYLFLLIYISATLFHHSAT